MCTMRIPGSVCRRRPVRLRGDSALKGLPEYVARRCSTPEGRSAFLKAVGVSYNVNGEMIVKPI